MSAPLPVFLSVSVALPGVSFDKARRYTLTDGLESLPELMVEVFSTDPSIDMAELVGQPATALLDEPAVPQLDGIVRRVEQRSVEATGASVYALTIVPHLWLTTQRSGHRIFQDKTALGILADVLAPYGVAMDRPEGVIFQRELTVHEYRVQWGETDHDFLRRALSEEGLSCCWSPDGSGKRVWIVTDEIHAGPVDMDVPFLHGSGALAGSEPHVLAVSVNARLCPSEVRVRDYDPEKPGFTLDRRAFGVDATAAEAPLSVYRYALGQFADEAGGDQLATLRLEEARAKSRTYRWEASFAMRPGMKIRLHDHPRDDANGEFLVVSAWTEVDLSSRKHVAEVVPASQAWRPRVLPKPRIHGTETAFVVGAPGKEIDVDEQGRVEVEFRWDTRDLHRAGASRRVRVVMPWAGPGRGFWTLPRVGDEVVVAYQHGDPDQPLVVGSVHNAVSPPARPLPEQQTQSWWVSRTTPGGDGYNYILMDDAAGAEILALRAQKDFDCEVHGEARTRVAKGQSIRVANGQSTQVGGDVSTTIQGSSTLEAKGVTIRSTSERTDETALYHSIRASSLLVETLFAVAIETDSVGVKAKTIRLETEGASIVMEAGKITLSAALVELNP